MSMKIINVEYERLVIEAKENLQEIENFKMKIADLAIKACTIKLGGHVRGFYSITNFGDDIGVNRKTLSCWIHNRKIQVELQKKKITVEDETELNKIRLTLREQDQGGKWNMGKYSEPVKVLGAYEKSNKKTQEDRMVENMLTSLGTINFRLDSYVLPKLNQENLENVKTLATQTLRILDTHFNRKRRSVKR